MNNKKAVALRYMEGVDAPLVVAKGTEKTAEKIVEIAQKNDVYITEDSVLVDLLGNVETGQIVPEQAWEALAVIFAFILERE